MFSLTDLKNKIDSARIKRGQERFNLSAFLKTKSLKELKESIESITGESAIWSDGSGRNRKTLCNEVIYFFIASKENYPVDIKKSNDAIELEKKISLMPKRSLPTFLYVFENDRANLLKVGISKNVERRVREVQDSCGCALKTIFAIEHSKAETLEKIIHEEISSFKTYGEWFDARYKSDILNIVKEISK